jgi:hypothetical protein
MKDPYILFFSAIESFRWPSWPHILAAEMLADEPLPQADQALPLADPFGRQGNGLEFIDGDELGQLHRAVLVGLAFDMLPLPGLAVGVGDKPSDSHRS